MYTKCSQPYRDTKNISSCQAIEQAGLKEVIFTKGNKKMAFL